MSRPSWDEYFLEMASTASLRSHDAETKHGCVIVKDSMVIGTGYNGFPRGMDDDSLPNTRPDKYPWMSHSEVNAVANCVIRPVDTTAYVTGKPCNACLLSLWQHGIIKVVHIDGHGTFDEKANCPKWREKFLGDTGMQVIPVAYKTRDQIVREFIQNEKKIYEEENRGSIISRCWNWLHKTAGSLPPTG